MATSVGLINKQEQMNVVQTGNACLKCVPVQAYVCTWLISSTNANINKSRFAGRGMFATSKGCCNSLQCEHVHQWRSFLCTFMSKDTETQYSNNRLR